MHENFCQGGAIYDVLVVRASLWDADRFGLSANLVDLLAAQMHLSTSYFQHIYKALFGVSVLHDVITARIEYAGYLMQNSGDPINRIAAACGYDNIEHFTRQFRKLKGYSPRQYQKLARQTEKEY